MDEGRRVKKGYAKMTKEEYLKALNTEPNTAQGAVYTQFHNNINEGLRLKKQYLDMLGISPQIIPQEQLIMADKYNVEPYTFRYPHMASDNNQYVAGEVVMPNELLSNAPIYKALLDEYK